MSMKDNKKYIGIRAIHKASDSIQNIQTEMIIELLTLKGLLPDDTQQSIRVNGTTSGTAPEPKAQDKFISGVKSFIRGLRR